MIEPVETSWQEDWDASELRRAAADRGFAEFQYMGAATVLVIFILAVVHGVCVMIASYTSSVTQ